MPLAIFRFDDRGGGYIMLALARCFVFAGHWAFLKHRKRSGTPT